MAETGDGGRFKRVAVRLDRDVSARAERMAAWRGGLTLAGYIRQALAASVRMDEAEAAADAAEAGAGR